MLKKSSIQSMDVRNEDVLVVTALILVDREAEADGHQFVLGEAAGGRVAQHRTGILVGVLPAQLLQQDIALVPSRSSDSAQRRPRPAALLA